MDGIICCHCGELFVWSPRNKNQKFCGKPECQRARKAAWQRHKMQTDPDYRFNQKLSNKKWVKSNPGYWKEYRKRNPEKAERNRILQMIRNQKVRDPHLVAKMDALKSNKIKVVGQFWLVPVIAKMEALKVNILEISNHYP